MGLVFVPSWKSMKMGNFHAKSKAIGFGLSSKLPQIEVGPVSIPSWKSMKMGNFHAKSKAIGFGFSSKLA